MNDSPADGFAAPSPQEALRAAVVAVIEDWLDPGDDVVELLLDRIMPLFAARVAAIEAATWEHREARAELNERCTQYRERSERAGAELAAMTAAGDPRWWRDRAEKLERQLTAASDTAEVLRADLTAAQERLMDEQTLRIEATTRALRAEQRVAACTCADIEEADLCLRTTCDHAKPLSSRSATAGTGGPSIIPAALDADTAGPPTRTGPVVNAQTALDLQRVAAERKQAAAQAWDEGWDARDDNDPNGQVFTQRDCADGDEINPYRFIDLTVEGPTP